MATPSDSLLASIRSFLSETRAPEPDFAANRQRMIIEQLTVPGHEIKDRRVLAAMAKVPRHEFVPAGMRSEAYEDHSVPIGHGRMILQPFVVAFMTELIDPEPDDNILEIGIGSGYQAAVLAELVRKVNSIEIIEPLARSAAARLKRLGYTNVAVRSGDGSKGWPAGELFDAVIVTYGSDNIPQPLIDQLKESGRIIIPSGVADPQQLYILSKAGGKIIKRSVLPVQFSPITIGHDTNGQDQLRGNSFFNDG